MYHGKQVSVAIADANIAVLKVLNSPWGYMDDTTEKELVLALDQIHKYPGISVVIITGGQADIFIRHYDTLVLETRGRQMAARGMKFDLARPVPEVSIHRVLKQVERSRCSYIAAINGIAMGGGFELALACDIRIAQAGNYRLGLPEVNLGLLPGAGGTQRLTRLIGRAKALELMLMGDTLSPRAARSYGLVNDVVDEPVLPVAMEFARALAQRSAKARAHIKYLVNEAHSSNQEASLASERTLFCDLLVDSKTHDRLQSFNSGQVDIHGHPLSDAA